MDIDIDVADRNVLLDLITHRIAKLESGKVHSTGVYFNEIPHNPFTNVATIDHKTAESRGYFKIDVLNVSIYRDVESNEHMDELVSREPIWELLQHPEVVTNLFHVSNHSAILKKLKPQSIEELAIALAIIRPAKRYLLNKDWDTIRQEVWQKPANGEYHFKKSHSFSYALAVVVHLNLLCEQLLKMNDETP